MLHSLCVKAQVHCNYLSHVTNVGRAALPAWELLACSSVCIMLHSSTHTHTHTPIPTLNVHAVQHPNFPCLLKKILYCSPLCMSLFVFSPSKRFHHYLKDKQWQQHNACQTGLWWENLSDVDGKGSITSLTAALVFCINASFVWNQVSFISGSKFLTENLPCHQTLFLTHKSHPDDKNPHKGRKTIRFL